MDFAGNTGNTNKHSVSIYAKKSAGTPTLSLEGAGGVNVTQTSWDRSVSANLTPGGSTENLRVTCPAGAVVRFVAAQLEEQPLATPFTLTNGSAASRSAANIQLPNVQGLDETQSWIAFRVRMGWASGTSGVPIALPKLLSWRDDATHRIELYYATSTSVWSLVRANPTNGTVHTAADTFSVNDEVTVIAAWTGAALTLSIDGAAFNSSADAFVPVIAQTTPYIGCEAGPAGHFDSPILFIATGKDPLSGGNAAAINNIARNNRIDSRPSDLPGGCTMKWPPADGDISRMLVAA